ncbi:MAG: glutamate--tRNA ligase [Candidatus Njordarchaeales archaeon]
MENLENIIRKHALINAVTHDGKADEKAVLKKLIAEVEGFRARLKDEEERERIMKTIREIVNAINSMDLETQKDILARNYGITIEIIREEKAKKTREGLPPLPNVDKVGKVITRFAPAPSGALHIGQLIRAAFLSYLYARMYNGKFILRIEDTDPRRIKAIYYDWIMEDLRAVGIEWDELVFESDHFDLYYELTRKLFEQGKAYVCTCSSEEFRKYREEKTPCPHRNTMDDVSYWEKMLDGTYKEGQAIVRLKTDMAHRNPAVRDPPLLRIIDSIPHPRTGYRYRVYPLYNYACAIEDHLSGVTYVIRGKEHETNEAIQREIYKAFGWEPPITIQYGMIKLPEAKIHKRHIRVALKEGRIHGWDDVTLPTVRAFLRRGITPEAFKRMAIELSIAKSDATLSLETLYSINRQILSARAKRISFVDEPFEMMIRGISQEIEVKMPWIPENPDAGFRRYIIKPLDERGGTINVYIANQDLPLIRQVIREDRLIRLKEFANVKIEAIDDEERKIVASFHSFEVIPGIRKIHWVPGGELAIQARVLMPDGTIKEGLVEFLVQSLKNGEYVQMERFGFGRIDSNQGELIVIAYAHP